MLYTLLTIHQEISAGQQLGLSSRGYRGVRLAGQEGRVQRFHDVLGEYLDGFRP